MDYDTKVYIVVGIAAVFFIGLMYFASRPLGRGKGSGGRYVGSGSSNSDDGSFNFGASGGDAGGGGDCGGSDGGGCGGGD
jgi:hypothetical protein